jgi:hypothetical protein
MKPSTNTFSVLLTTFPSSHKSRESNTRCNVPIHSTVTRLLKHILSVLIHIPHTRILTRILMIMRALAHERRRIHLLQAPQIHRLLQQRQHIRIKRLPVWVVEVVLLGLNQIASALIIPLHFDQITQPI